MLVLGVDEITLVLQLKDKNNSDCLTDSGYLKWSSTAETIIDTFEYKADFENVFGERTLEKQPPQGYTTAYTYGENNFVTIQSL